MSEALVYEIAVRVVYAITTVIAAGAIAAAVLTAIQHRRERLP